jgi:protein tyrosine phosphatase (PTP) superfamily phosphohydrolase (DUF442 family)
VKREKPASPKLSRTAEGLASWLTFEARSGRRLLFCESYLKYPLAQLLKFQFRGRVRHEREHPALAKCKPGHKYRVDYVVLGKGEGDRWKLAVEVKWAPAKTEPASRLSALRYGLLRDVLRLSLLVDQHAEHGVLFLAGKTQSLERLLEHQLFKQNPNLPANTAFLPTKDNCKTTLKLGPVPDSGLPPHVVRAFSRTLLATGVMCIAHFESECYAVYVWRISRHDVKLRQDER